MGLQKMIVRLDRVLRHCGYIVLASPTTNTFHYNDKVINYFMIEVEC